MKKKNFHIASIFSLALIAFNPANAQSLIPYTFKDGEVISADTLNDLFDSIRRVSEGFSSISQLEGTWNCTTYDLSGQTPTNGMPNTQYAVDNATGLYAVDQSWVFSNGGKTLTVDKVILGGMAENNSGGCGGGDSVPTATYSAAMFGPFVGLAGVSPGCVNSNSFVLDVRRLTPYKFVAPTKMAVVSCEMAAHAPEAPIGLAAAASGSGVSLNWTANNDLPTGYKIYKKTNGEYQELATVTGVSYVDTTGVAGDMYRVAAYNANGTSIRSAAVLVK